MTPILMAGNLLCCQQMHELLKWICCLLLGILISLNTPSVVKNRLAMLSLHLGASKGACRALRGILK